MIDLELLKDFLTNLENLNDEELVDYMTEDEIDRKLLKDYLEVNREDLIEEVKEEIEFLED